MNRTFDFCRTTPKHVTRRTTTFVEDETAIKFGFTVENHNDGEIFVLKRGNTRIEFDRLDQVQCWLKGYEFNVVQTSEYA
jgi:hypothetical protein